MPKIKFIIIAVIALIIGICGISIAEEAKEDKTKGLDIVTDTAQAIIKKTNAFFQGNLEWTMQPGSPSYRNDYRVDALGDRTPRSTLGKYDSGGR